MNLENNWKSVWNNHKTNFTSFEGLTDEQIVLELKAIDGFDVGESALTYDAFFNEITKTFERLNKSENRTGGGYSVCI